MSDTDIDRSFTEPKIQLECTCGWRGPDDAIEDWAVERDRDRVVRRCPDCGEPVPEWGAFPSIDGAAMLARGSLRAALVDAGVLEDADER